MGREMTGRLRRASMLVGGLALAVAQPALGQAGLPKPVDAAEAVVMVDVVKVLRDGDPSLQALDGLLARLPRATPLRGMVQSGRAVALLSASRLPEAQRSAEESVRLSPGAPYPRIIASYVLTFTGAYLPAAGYWLEASTIDPAAARQSDEYALNALVGRLREVGERALADRVEARMGEVGVLSSLAPTRSGSALARVRSTFAADGAAAAQPMVSDILDPADMLKLYVDRDYAPLWPGIDAWAGQCFAPLYARYIEELRREWWVRHDHDAAVNYARALNRAQQYRATVELFLPLVSGEQAGEYRPSVEFLAPVVARALSAAGRGEEAVAMLERIGRLVPAEAEGLRLNLSAGVLTRAYEAQDWTALAPRAEAWVATAERLGPDVNVSAILDVQVYRACALERLGRTVEAAPIAANVEAAANALPVAALNLYTCRGDARSAKALILRVLTRPGSRAEVLTLLQPDVPDAGEQPMSRETRLFHDTLRQDAEIRAAVAKVGRLLPYSPAPVLPEGFDPLLAGPKGKPVPDSI